MSAQPRDAVVLGIDTSNYCTSVALAGTDDTVRAACRRLLDVPQGALGLQQSQAVFQHVRRLPSLLAEAARHARGAPIAAVCASTRPRAAADSYMPVFVVGESQARAVASLLCVPFYATDHQAGHLRAALHEATVVGGGAQASSLSGDMLALHLSGGTTELLWQHGGTLHLLGGTRDVSAGQLVDRTGVLLGLPFPCGPSLEALAVRGTVQQRLPASLDGLWCHFSGAEAQVKRWVAQGTLSSQDIAAEVYALLARTLSRMIAGAAAHSGAHCALLAGGVASSALLRESLCARLRRQAPHVMLAFARPDLAGDNAVGVALLGAERLRAGEPGTPETTHPLCDGQGEEDEG